MKNKDRLFYLLFLVFVGLVAFAKFCPPKNRYEKQIEEMRKAANTDDAIIDTVFLGLRFGMSKSDYLSHCSRLEKDGKVEKYSDGIYSYVLKGMLEDYKCLFNAEYFEGGLYKVTVQTMPKESVELASIKFAEIVEGKYRAKRIEQPMKKYSGCDSYTYNKGNLEINIYCTISGAVNMVYTDKRLDVKSKAVQDSLKKIDDKKTTQDF